MHGNENKKKLTASTVNLMTFVTAVFCHIYSDNVTRTFGETFAEYIIF